MKRLICLTLFMACILSMSSQRVESVTLRNPDALLAPPVIRLGTDDRLILSFDIIGESHLYLRYRFLHCNADWTRSRLLESEFVDGFNEGEISDYAYSSDTYVHYVNYQLVIPDKNMEPLVSGNYIIQVYPEDAPEDIILEERFAVTENSTVVGANLTSRTDRGFNTEWQQLSLDVDMSGLHMANPYQDFVVTVTQNNRLATERTISHPLRVNGNQIMFDHNPDLIFGGSNEYRRFETVRVDYPGMNVDSVVFGGSNWHAWLHPDQPRHNSSYNYDSTAHGRFVVDEYNSTDPDLGADYVSVHFSLQSPPFPGYDVYIDGEFTRNEFSERNRMQYDYDRSEYQAMIPLKQGSYNYQYVLVPVEKKANLSERAEDIDLNNLPLRVEGKSYTSSTADPAPIEGNFYDTRNEYLIKVFYRPPGARYDKLIGIASID